MLEGKHPAFDDLVSDYLNADGICVDDLREYLAKNGHRPVVQKFRDELAHAILQDSVSPEENERLTFQDFEPRMIYVHG